MKKPINTIFSGKLLKMIILVACVAVSYYATFTGFHDLIGQSSKLTFGSAAFAAVFTAAVLFCFIKFSKDWRKTRVWRHLIAWIAAIFISILFGWGFYFDQLNLDQTLAGKDYSEERDKMLAVARSNKAIVGNLVQKIDALAAHSESKMEEERKGGNTCGVMLQGHGPRAAFREHDSDKLKYYQNAFGQTSNEFDRVYKNMGEVNFRNYSIDNAELLNGYAQDMNAIIDGFNKERYSLLSWLQHRLRHNEPGFSERFDDGIFREDIRCPDEEIKSHYDYFKQTASFNKLPPVKILTPDKSGVQVTQSFDMFLKLIKFELSAYEFLALVFAIFIDLMIFMLAYTKPNSSPPTPFSSWSKYFSGGEHKELMKFFVISKAKRGHFYIPVNRTDLTEIMIPLIANDMVVFKRRIFWGEELFRVPQDIRAQANGSRFNHYQLNVHSVAQWILDWKYEKQRQAAIAQNTGVRYSPSNSASCRDYAKSTPDIAFNMFKSKSSLNGNGTRGIRNEIQ